jgi:formate-dependent nitrite reductase membrane component NrfD
MDHHYMWSWPIYWYLFMAGVGAGATAISAFVYLRGANGNFGEGYLNIAKYGAFIGPLPVILGTGFLIFELGRPFRAFNIMTSNFWYKVINPSPMNFGGWFLILFGAVSVLYACCFIDWKKWIAGDTGEFLSRLTSKWHTILAGICAPLSIATAIYTAILLGAMPSRPLWNSPVLWALFTVSALSTGIAAVMLANRLSFKSNGDSNHTRTFQNSSFWLAGYDAILIVVELIIIALFIMYAYLTVYNQQYSISVLLPGGELATHFWVGVVLIGLVVPLLVEGFLVLRKVVTGNEFHAPYVFELALPVAVLVGGFVLRYVIVIGGQMTGPIGI